MDHFVPWSRYPLDLAHNFVLTHAGCNDSKSNLLASIEHLERWCARNVERERVLVDMFAERRLGHGLARDHPLGVRGRRAERVQGMEVAQRAIGGAESGVAR